MRADVARASLLSGLPNLSLLTNTTFKPCLLSKKSTLNAAPLFGKSKSPLFDTFLLRSRAYHVTLISLSAFPSQRLHRGRWRRGPQRYR